MTKPYEGVVVARERGYYGSKLREPGERFCFSGILGRWMDPVDEPAPAEEPKPHPNSREGVVAQIVALAGDDPVEIPHDATMRDLREMLEEMRQ